MENRIFVKLSLSCPEGEYTIHEYPISAVSKDGEHCIYPETHFSVSTILDSIFPDDLPF